MRNMMKSGWGKMSMAFLGALIYALGINLFVVPLGLITGGMMGFCQLIRSAILMLLRMDSFSFDIAGLIFYALNIPLLLLAYRSLGKVFSRNTLIISTAYTVFLSIIPGQAPCGRYAHQLSAGRHYRRHRLRTGAHQRQLWRRTAYPGSVFIQEGRTDHGGPV